jgi:hypothetical protein
MYAFDMGRRAEVGDGKEGGGNSVGSKPLKQ